MCLIVFSYKEHADFPFIFAGNRDEFHARPASAAHFWDAHPHLLAGRDLQAGGTWLGVTFDGRFATVTNYREPAQQVPEARSRGEIVTDFLGHPETSERFLARLRARAHRYGGFNLILGTVGALYYYTNRGAANRGAANRSTADRGAAGRSTAGRGAASRGTADPGTADSGASNRGAAGPGTADGGASNRDTSGDVAERDASASEADLISDVEGVATESAPVLIPPGLHGLSNERLNTPWPKVRRAKTLFEPIVAEGEPDPEALLELLSDTTQPPETELPTIDGIDPAWERALSSIFIPGDVYGTRASTVVVLRSDGKLTFAERTYGPGGQTGGTVSFEITVGSPDT